MGASAMGRVNLDILSDTQTSDYAMEEVRRSLPNGIVVSSVLDMVDKINRRTVNDKLGRLRVFGHGSPGHQAVGSVLVRQTAGRSHYDYAGDSSKLLVVVRVILAARDGTTGGSSDALFNKHKLLQLKSRFASDGWVELHGCNVAMGELGTRLLRNLALLWQVSVKAGLELQFSGGGFEGRTVVARPNGDVEDPNPIPTPPGDESGCGNSLF